MLAVLLAALESDTDRQKFIEIYEKYHVQMERTAMRILKEQSDVEDAVQNAFMQMIRHFEKIFEIPCEELPFWIISIVKNEARAILRKNRRTVSLEDWDGFAEHIDDISGYTELVDLFTQLPKTYRSVLELKMPDEFQTLKKERCIEIIKACNGSGIPKRQWCREHGISYSTFMRWQRSLRNELAGEITVRLTLSIASMAEG